MSDGVYKTANGKALDMGALVARNEDVKAVGNMGVNAKGEKVEPRYSNKPKQEYDGRLNKRPEKSRGKVRVTHGRLSPALSAMDHDARDKAPAFKPVNLAEEPAFVDFSAVNIAEQIEAVADQLVDQIADVTEEELIEIADVVEPTPVEEAPKPEKLVGLAAAMAKAKKAKGSK